MSWKRGLLVALAVCALLGGSAGCGTGAAHERRDAVSPSPVGKILDETDKEGRHYRAAAKAEAVAGRGVALLSLDGRTLATLRTAEYHLTGDLVPRGTHHITARLYADDRTAWAVGGKPVESTADITASGAAPTPTSAPASTSTVSGSGIAARTEPGGSPDSGGQAS
jgi:hypothetical protein